ncbi:MAG: hypothetical protein HGA47_15275 [Zoogloea sp.]|nr:hypothetical protein [Zoogloea sp.]
MQGKNRTRAPAPAGGLERTHRLPHERDEAPDPDDVGTAGGDSSKGPRQVIEQAASDISHGLKDTERRGLPSDVPVSGRKPGASGDAGASVPPQGVSRHGYSQAQKGKPGKEGGRH